MTPPPTVDTPMALNIECERAHAICIKQLKSNYIAHQKYNKTYLQIITLKDVKIVHFTYK